MSSFAPTRRRPLLAALCALAVLAVAAAAQQPGADSLAGTYAARPFRLAFDGAGWWQVTMRGTIAVTGAYQLRGDTLVLHDTGGPRGCPPEQVGRYQWRRSADTLSLRLLEDACEGRDGALARPWTRSVLEALVGATLIDGTGSAAQPGMTIVVEGDRIQDVFPDGARPAPAGAETVDVAGRWVVPGLIDTHVHLATDPSGEDSREVTLAHLAAELHGGVTTVRDMGGDARTLAWLARDALLGDIEAPSIVYGAIWAGPDFFDDPRVLSASRGLPPGSAPWARAIRDDTDLPLAVAEARGAGARALKLYADLRPEQVMRIVAEAHRQGMLVWAHATLFPARPSDLADAGVDVVSHAGLLAWAAADSLPGWRQRAHPDYARVPPTADRLESLLRDMAEKGTILDATLHVYTTDTTATATAAAAWAARATARAQRLGVRVSAGTDDMMGAGPGALPNLHHELRLLVERAGFTPLEAIAAATSVAADALGLEDRGVIAPGRRADLVVLERDPTADIANTRSVMWVMKGGMRYAGAKPPAPMVEKSH